MKEFVGYLVFPVFREAVQTSLSSHGGEGRTRGGRKATRAPLWDTGQHTNCDDCQDTFLLAKP